MSQGHGKKIKAKEAPCPDAAKQAKHRAAENMASMPKLGYDGFGKASE